MVKRIILILAGLLLVISALHSVCTVHRNLEIFRQLEQLPDYDHIAEIKQLIKDKRYGEAQVICEDVIALELPGTSEALKLLEQCVTERRKIWNRIYKGGRAFITGNPDSSIEELGGAMAADMLMYGDIRDLALQGWFKVTGKESDNVVMALAGVGLLTEFVDLADWMPAFFKALRKVGALTDGFAKSLAEVCSKLIKTRKLDIPSKKLFANSKTMFDQAGLIRSKTLFKSIKNTDDLNVIAKYTAKSPAETHLIARAMPEHTAAVLEPLAKKENSQLKKLILRKGKECARLAKYTARVLKIGYKGFGGKLLTTLFGKNIYWLAPLLVLGGMFCIWLGIKRKKRPAEPKV